MRAGEGHQGVPLGMAEIATALYTRHLKFDAADPTWPDRDRVVLSNGHGSMLLYALLHLSGYERIGIEQVSTFRDFGSRCEGHPEFDIASGIEVTTGPLGQGIANAFGMAVAEAYLNARFGAGVVDHRTYAFVGDGCLQEGIGQEMISLAGHLRLGKLTLLWDDNRITDDGATDLSISEDVAARFRVAGWHVVEVDGHDVEAVSAAIGAAKADPRPSLIACRTVIAKGIARLQGQRGGHSAKLFPEDAAAAREQLGWSSPAFEIPADVLAAWRDAGRRGRAERERWRARVAALPPAQRAEFERIVAGELPEGWRDVLLEYKRGALDREPLASGIFISAEINDLLVDRMPERMVACADLEAPTNHKRRLAAFTAAGPQRRLRALRRARARDGRDGQRHGGARRRRAAGRHLPGVLRLRAPGDAHGRADGAAGEVRLQPRLDRHRPQRADAPAGRDPGVAARDAQHAGAASGRCGRGGRVLGDRVRASPRAVDARLRAPGAAARSPHAHEREPVAARRLRARRGRRRAARSHAAGDRLRGGARAGRARRAASRRHADGRGLDAELGAVRGAGCRLPVERARRPAPCAWLAKRRCASAGIAGSASAAASSA